MSVRSLLPRHTRCQSRPVPPDRPGPWGALEQHPWVTPVPLTNCCVSPTLKLERSWWKTFGKGCPVLTELCTGSTLSDPCITDGAWLL